MAEKNNTYRGLSVNLKKLIDYFDINISDLHRATGVPITTIFRLLSGECVNPTLASVIPLAEHFKVPLMQLIGLEELTLEPKQSHKIKHLKKVPIISWNEVNKWMSNAPVTTDKFVDTCLNLSHRAFALIVDTDEMQGFPKNSILIIEPAKEPIHHNFIIAYKKGGARASLKQYLVEEGDIFLRPLRNNIPSQLRDENTVIYGIVFQVVFN